MKLPELGAVANGGRMAAKFGMLLEPELGIPDCIGWDSDEEGPGDGTDADPVGGNPK